MSGRSSTLKLWILAAAIIASSLAISWLAAISKSPTYDEPMHTIAAWHELHRRDYRIDPEDPPLWKYWAALGSGSHVDPNTNSTLWKDLIDKPFLKWVWCNEALYATPG